MQTKTQQSGFTLVELAILILVVIGLILGIAFKGKDPIDSAKVKTWQRKHNKLLPGANTLARNMANARAMAVRQRVRPLPNVIPLPD